MARLPCASWRHRRPPVPSAAPRSLRFWPSPALQLVGVLPPEFELTTVYTVGVTAHAANPEAARKLAALLTAPQAEPIRRQVGFGR